VTKVKSALLFEVEDSDQSGSTPNRDWRAGKEDLLKPASSVVLSASEPRRKRDMLIGLWRHEELLRRYRGVVRPRN